ncbi:MAG: hypothetical protein QME68_05850 [Elusimicrobiota bacterium]|nr:hypothetical protein [Elusimicrobiota bacterium]
MNTDNYTYSLTRLLTYSLLITILVFWSPLVVADDKPKETKIHLQEKPVTPKHPRGSKEEIEEFKKHKLDLPEEEPQETQEILPSPEASSEKPISKPEKPEKLDKEKNLHKVPPAKPLKQRKISHPDKFKVKYNLKNAAEIAVNILNANYFPVSTFIITGKDAKNIKLGAKKGQNEFNLWDGKDAYGDEAPPGEYYACLSVVYKNGKQETIGFKFVKE